MGNIAKATSGTQLKSAAVEQENGIKQMLTNAWPRIREVMPKHMKPERMYQLALSSINTTPKLAECSPATLLSCIMKCSALGLEPSAVDGLGRAYILPYNSKKGMQAQLIIGYKGMLDLARRSGQIKDISARAVYKGDEFSYEFGLNEHLQHKPLGREHTANEKPTHVYMVAHFKDGGHYMDVMTQQEVEEVRKRSKAANNGPWVTDYEAMAKKTVIRRAFPYLPVSVEAMSAAAADNTDGGYVQHLTNDTIIEPVFEVEEEPAAADTEPKGLHSAVCKSCGNIAEVAPDSNLSDLNAVMPCCENPDYEWREQ